MTEPNLSVSNNSWNPTTKEFWGANPDKKSNLLFATAMIGLMISFVGFLWWEVGIGRFPTFHAFFLLLTVKMKNRPTRTFRILLVLLSIWGCLKCFFHFWVVYMNYYFDGDLFQFFFIESLCLLLLLVTNLILWKQTQMNVRESKVRMWHPEIYLFVVFSISILQTINSYSEVENFFHSIDTGIAKALSFGPLIFWSSFALLHVYRVEIDQWKGPIPVNHTDIMAQAGSNRGLDSYKASRLLAAKELLDNGTITMDEFLNIKGEHLGSKDEPTYVRAMPVASAVHDYGSINSNYKGPKKRDSSTKIEELKELTKMKKEGLITDSEYEKMKKEVID